MPLDLARVAAESAAWTWYPDDARVVETDEHLLVAYPDWFHEPLQLLRLHISRPVAGVLEEVLDAARDLAAGRPALTHLAVQVRMDAPADLVPELRRRGAEVAETLDVLAADLSGCSSGGAADLGEWPGVTVSWVDDLPTARDFGAVEASVFGGEVPDPADTARAERSLAEARAELATGAGQLVAYLEGRAVGVAGLARGSATARLWGGGVLEDARGRGVYRALLASRLERGVLLGADLALVKGRVETSAPILRRAGFEVVGREETLRLPL
ncbi:GNAT family N-acetyltransferase [Nocardioides bruguierae]|uniref:GNAT family N-acetyltransferase n=1 Tax=Nocardioides bruguierae TaxID=2945102 RepID=UPI002020275D|nr:GNAT family N-acetyltransferase [Nocardioides bruguierae]MCL8027135.1 GNAT family N-acetyltransferase [Nocardioides bruguierae]